MSTMARQRDDSQSRGPWGGDELPIRSSRGRKGKKNDRRVCRYCVENTMSDERASDNTKQAPTWKSSPQMSERRLRHRMGVWRGALPVRDGRKAGRVFSALSVSLSISIENPSR